MNMEFHAGGNIPAKLINSFLYGQCMAFGHVSKRFVEDGAGQERVRELERKVDALMRDPTHPLHAGGR